MHYKRIKWNGFNNGQLLSQYVDNSFDVVLTMDKKPHASAKSRQISYVNLVSFTSKIEELVSCHTYVDG